MARKTTKKKTSAKRKTSARKSAKKKTTRKKTAAPAKAKGPKRGEIKGLRKTIGISQDAFGKAFFGISGSTYGKFERGKGMLSKKAVDKYAKVKKKIKEKF